VENGFLQPCRTPDQRAAKMNTITPQLTLLYYDYPQVFIGVDKVGTQSVCMATSENESGVVYTCVQISESRKNALTNGEIDLRAAFEFPELDVFLEARPCKNSADLNFDFIPKDNFDSNLLPEAGLFFDVHDEVAIKAAELNTTVSYFSLSVPEASKSARIKSATLSEFLSLFQNVIKYLTRHSAKEHKIKINKETLPFETDVFGFSMGSFTVHLRSSSEYDIFGDNALLSHTLTRLNLFLESIGSPEEAINFLHDIKGHSAGSLVKLLSFLSENSCPIRHRWANPSMQISDQRIVALDKIRALVEICKQRSDLITEKVKFIGSVSMADEKNRSWKIFNEVDNAIYSGDVRDTSHISLAGIVIGKGRYEFECEEVIETVLATSREKKQYYLVAYKSLTE
jgi:hypothetical protein